MQRRLLLHLVESDRHEPCKCLDSQTGLCWKMLEGSPPGDPCEGSTGLRLLQVLTYCEESSKPKCKSERRHREGTVADQTRRFPGSQMFKAPPCSTVWTVFYSFVMETFFPSCKRGSRVKGEAQLAARHLQDPSRC